MTGDVTPLAALATWQQVQEAQVVMAPAGQVDQVVRAQAGQGIRIDLRVDRRVDPEQADRQVDHQVDRVDQVE